MIRQIAYVSALLCLFATPAAAESYLEVFRDSTQILPNRELRAAWVVRHALNSRESVDRAVDYAVNARFQLLFVQVRGRADAYYLSDLEPEASMLAQPIGEFDPLEYFLVRAHEEGIAVHAWINVFYVWSDFEEDPPDGHIVKEHPEWLMADEDGQRMEQRPVKYWQQRGLEGYYVSPSNAAARNHIVAVAADITAKYDVDGVHLDYVRYPGAGFDFSTAARSEFELRYGVDPLDIRRGTVDPSWLDIDVEDAANLLDSLYVDWRVSQVDSVVAGVRRAIGDIALSAAVIPDFASARITKGQDWPGWVTKGYVDFVVPMAYTYEPAELRRRMRVITRAIGVGNYIVGLPVFDQRAQFVGYSVSLLRQDGIIGYSLFSYNALDEQPYSLQFLEKVFLQDPAEVSPGSP